MSGSLLSDHLTPNELSSLSCKDQALLRSVIIIKALPPAAADEYLFTAAATTATTNSQQDDEPYPLVGFECAYCASSPLVTVPPSGLIRVFPISLDAIGASLQLLRDNHFDDEDQRCVLLPFVEEKIFIDSTDESSLKDLQLCCQTAAQRIGIKNKVPGKKDGLIMMNTNNTINDNNEMTQQQPHQAGPWRTGTTMTLPPQSNKLKPLEHSQLINNNINNNNSDNSNNEGDLKEFRFSQGSRSASNFEKSAVDRATFVVEDNNNSEMPPSSLAHGEQQLSSYGLSSASSRPNHATVAFPGTLSNLAFIHDGQGWACPNCYHIPFHLRAEGSYHPMVTSPDQQMNHFVRCAALQRQQSTTNSRFAAASSYHGYHQQQHQQQYPFAYCEPINPTTRNSTTAASLVTTMPPPPQQLSLLLANSENNKNNTTSNFETRGGSSIPPQQSSRSSPPFSNNNNESTALVGRTSATLIAKDNNKNSSTKVTPLYSRDNNIVNNSNNSSSSRVLVATAASSRKNINNVVVVDNNNISIAPDDHDRMMMLVLPEDKLLLTDYFYYINQQLRICKFNLEDRAKTRGGKRKFIDVGFGGIVCYHCKERKFFWRNVDLLANSFSEICNHVTNCASQSVQLQLKEKKLHHPYEMSKLPRGWQKVFFRRMWRRIHNNENESNHNNSNNDTNNDDVVAVVDSGGGTSSSSAADMDELEQKVTNNNSNCSRPQDINQKIVLTLASGEIAAPPSSRGACLLAIPEDKQWLSDTDCFIRSCLEVFAAKEEDILALHVNVSNNTTNNKKSGGIKGVVDVGRVGIRCIYCAASSMNSSKKAVIYPPTIDDIYESVRDIQKIHFSTCSNTPPEQRAKLYSTNTQSSLSSIVRRYYVIAAKALDLGLYDTDDDGIRAKKEMEITPLSILNTQR